MFTNKDFDERFEPWFLLNPFQNGLYIFHDFLLEFYQNFMSLSNIDPYREQVPLNCQSDNPSTKYFLLIRTF